MRHPQEDLLYLEASEDSGEDFYNGSGAERPPEHFPRLWCPNGTYSSGGQVRWRKQTKGKGSSQSSKMTEPLSCDS